MLPFSEQILEWARRNGQGALPTPDFAPPTPNLEQPPEAPPAPPPAATVPSPGAAAPLPDPRLGAMADYLRQYGPQQLAAAQEEDNRLRGVQGLAEGFNRAAMLIGRLPSQAQTPQIDSRVRDYLLRKQSAQEDMGLQGQMATLAAQTDPASRESVIARFAAQKAGHALPDNFSARDVASYVAAVKAGAEPSEILSKIGQNVAATQETIEKTKGLPGQREQVAAQTAQIREQTLSEPGKRALAAAETFAKQRANQQVSPEYVSQIATDLGVKLAPGMTYGEAKDRIDEALKARQLGIEEGKAGQQKTQQTGEMRKEFEGQDTVKNMQLVAAALEKIQRTDNSPAGDMALIYNLMKIWDPGSRVTESEFNAAGNAGGLPDRIQGAYNKLKGEGRLSDQMRREFRKAAADAYEGQRARYDKIAGQFQRVAGETGLNPANVVLDTGIGPAQPVTVAASPAEGKPLTMTGKDGNEYVWRNGGWERP